MLVPSLATAQGLGEDPERLVLSLSFVDVPAAALPTYHWPTWEQALEVNLAVSEAAHAAIHFGFSQWPQRGWSVAFELVSTAIFDWLLMPRLPGGDVWLHEEGHRAAMFASGLPSRNALDNVFYRPEERCDPGAVCGMSDEQISAVKERRSADWVRVQAAGMEAELEQARRLERDVLFYDQPAYQRIPLYALHIGSVIFYRALCAAPDAYTPEDVLKESADIRNRDFTGLDCRGWVTDLFRPEQPYAARGAHPLGGVRRSRLYEDLAPEEQSYLRTMRNLGFLNLVDPNLFGLTGVDLSIRGTPTRLNAAFGHHLTSFGDAFVFSLFARQQQLRLYGELLLFRNYTGYFPGLHLQWVRLPLRTFRPLYLGASLWVWAQPRNQSFYDNTPLPGAAVEASLSVPILPHLEAFAEVGAKSAGWVVAKPSLDASVDFRLGLTLVL